LKVLIYLKKKRVVKSLEKWKNSAELEVIERERELDNLVRDDYPLVGGWG
jgi:hypothetical protein